MTDEHIAQDEVEFVGPGQLLQQARSRAGLSVEQIAAKLNLKPQSILNIEQEEFDNRISVTFTRGYLKAYAKQVGLDEADVLSAFEKLNTTGKEPAKLQSFSRRVANQASDDRLMLVSYAILIVIIGLFVAWWWQQDSDVAIVEAPALPALEQEANTQTRDETSELPGNSTETVSSQELTGLLTDEPKAEVAADDSPVVAEVSPQSESELEQLQAEAQNYQRDLVNTETEATNEVNTSNVAEVVENSEEVVSEPTTPVIAEQPQSLVEQEPDSEVAVASEQVLGEPVDLVFEFSGDCWMQLKDATGEAIAYGVKKEGRVMPVSGIPPFEVILGAPQVVSISYAGQSIDMSQFPRGRTARFNLPISVSEGE